MSIDSIELRNALGQFPTGVCLVTCAPENGVPFGMTVNSFASLSLDPALILWSLQKNSDLEDAWGSATHYAVNVLTSAQQSLSTEYAKKYHHNLREDDFFIGETGNPVIKGCLASFECKINTRHDGGDHIIFVGEVLAMAQNENDLEPLVFHAGNYRELVPK